jgi:Pro-kumamolisin, activation domain/Abnormal spindle-like microcephaly-assoc'd, ASPM-SPD-2-Hydin
VKTKILTLMIACWSLGFAAWLPATAQTTTQLQPATEAPVPSRVLTAVDDVKRTTLPGNTHPMARKQFESGRVASSVRMERIMLVLKRSPEQEGALEKFLTGLYDPTSPDFHHWLHAEEFGRLYGPSDSDVAAVTDWLQKHGFEIYDVNNGRTIIQFSGTSAQVEEAFQLEMHTYQVNGEAHIANDRDPSIPEALAPVITGVASLHNFFAKPQHVIGKSVSIDRDTGKKTRIESQAARSGQTDSNSNLKLGRDAAGSSAGAAPQLTYAANGDTYEELTPYDFATIYNILPLWQASSPINGSGITIAISGVSDILQADVDSFRSTFGLPAMTLKTIANGTDPGADKAGGQEENSLDVEMAGATAPGAQIVMVVSASTATTGADLLSDEYIIDKETAYIMSASYGECELNLGTSGNAAYNTVWQQGATEGISIFESAGDQGSAGCSDSDTAGPNADKIGLQVNGIASSPYVTAVGGTDFTWSFTSNGTTTYWNSTNGKQDQTAKGIMPEVPWNSTCTNPLLDPLFGATSEEELCNGLLTYDSGYFDGLIVITGGSGGISKCTKPTGTTSSTCAGGWPKPSWQTGYGSSSNRELPDVSLFASGGFPSTVNGSAILFCDSEENGTSPGSCNYSSASGTEEQEVGGTSASSPLWAGIMALIDQKNGGKQGLANPTFYGLYAKQVKAGTSCNSSTVTNGNSCVFYDVTQGNNSQVCFTGDPNCGTNTSGDQLGVLSGYSAATGYDDATGLGTVNVTNLVNGWPSTTTTTTTVSLSSTGLMFSSTADGSTSAAQTVTITNTGTGAVTLTSETLTGTNASSYVISANTCTSSLASNANCAVSIEFKPTATGTLTASLSVADNATGSPQTVPLTGTGSASTAPNVSLAPTSLMFASQTVGTASASQAITLSNTGNAALSITSISITGTNSSDFTETNTCGTSVAQSATCTITVVFQPTAAGNRTASISIADNAAGNPQTASLTGTAAPAPAGSFTLSSNPGSISVAAGASGSTTLTVTPSNGFNQPVSFACTGLPSEATCSFSPTTVTPNGAAATTTVTIAATGSASAANHLPSSPDQRSHLMLGLGGLFGFVLCGSALRKRGTRLRAFLLAFVAAVLTFGAMQGCGGGGSSSTPPASPGTPAGTYSVTVTGTSGSGTSALTGTAAVSLTVQ